VDEIRVWPVLGFAILLLGLLLAQAVRRRRRTKELRELAARTGMEFHLEGSVFRMEAFSYLPVFGRGSGQRISNVLHGRDEYILELEYSTGAGEDKKKHEVTVVALRDRNTLLPAFAATSHRGRVDRSYAKGLGEIVKFGESPEFSRRYRLVGDSDDVREVFDQGTRMYLADNSRWSIEGSAEWLVLFKEDTIVPASELLAFREQARQIAEYLRSGV